MANIKKDSKGRKLNKGEQQRADGTYHYTYLDCNKKRKYLYAKTLNCSIVNRVDTIFKEKHLRTVA